MDGVGAPLLWLRSALLSAVVLGGGVVAHVSAAGRLPGPTGLVLITVVTTLGCAVWLNRPASARRVVLLTAAGQTWVHAVLTATSGHHGDGVATRAVTRAATHSAPPPQPAAPVSGGSYFDVYDATRPAVADGAPTLPAPVLHVLADLSSDHAPMMLAHLAAAVVVGAWLASGERALWALVAALAGATPVVRLRPVAVPLLRPVRPEPAPPASTPEHLLTRYVVRRGPPAALVLAA